MTHFTLTLRVSVTTFWLLQMMKASDAWFLFHLTTRAMTRWQQPSDVTGSLTSGLPDDFHSNREAVFNSNKFGVYLASQGTTLEMITAGDQHTWLGLLDRRAQHVYRMCKDLLPDLSNEHLSAEKKTKPPKA